MKALFVWLDANPAVYGAIGVVATLPLAVWLTLALRRERGALGTLRSGWVPVLFLFVMAGWRWPALLEVRDVGVEEARLVAAALSLEQPDGVSFRAVDPLDGGPIPLLALWPTRALGVPQDYFNARLAALLMDWGALVIGLGLLRARFGAAVAVSGLLPTLMVLAGVVDQRVVIYSAWHAVLLITMAAIALGARGWWRMKAGRRATAWWVGAGFFAGLLGWCGPEARWWMGALGVAAMWAVAKTRTERLRVTGAVIAGLAYAAALGWCWLHGIGHVEDFWIRYRVASLGKDAALPGTGWIVAAAAFAAAVGLGVVRERSRWWRVAVGFAVVGGAIPVAARVAAGAPEIWGKFAEYWRQPRGETAQAIMAFARAGDTMAVWGWRPELHVETGLRQAVRSTTSAREIGPVSPGDRMYFRRRYMKELRENAPVFFVDAVAPGTGRFTQRERPGHETFAELGDLVRYEYVLIKETGSGRIYMNGEEVRARNPKRRGVVPLVREAMTRVEAGIPLNPLSDTRLMAHAPSLLEHPVPPGAEWLRGAFGIMADAYLRQGEATDGAVFAIDVIDARGRSERRFARKLDPIRREEDRGTFEFTVDLRGLGAASVQLVTEAGERSDFDWTYWEALRFEGESLP
jgi:hypothetical protein